MQEINLDNFENYIYDNYQVRISVETPCVIDENKPNCVFGVLVSLEGLKIKDELQIT